MQGVLPFVVRRLVWLPFTLLVISLVTFALGRFGPGDPIALLIGQRHDPETEERIRHQKGLDKPFFEQYWIYIKGVVTRFDLGESLTKYPGQNVNDVLFPRMGVSVQIGVMALFVTFALGIPVGILAALRQGTWLDPFIISFFLMFQSIPVLVMIPIVQLIFVLKLGVLPTRGWPEETTTLLFIPNIGLFSTEVILPVLVLSLPGIAGVARLMRVTTLSVLDQDYVRTARAKGLQEFTVVSRHVARNALLPMITVIGFSLATVFEGSFFVETFFGIPGVGRLAFESVFERDYDIIMALVLLGAAAFVFVNILVDIAYTIIDPRVRYGSVGS